MRTPDQRAIFEAEALPHLDGLYRTALYLLRDATRAADAVQETFLVAWKSFHRYQPGTNCRAWLHQILYRVAHQQRRAGLRWLTGREEDIRTSPLPAEEPLPTQLSDPDLLGALGQLPDVYREVVVLVDVEELSYREAAGVLGVPVGTVMSRVSRGREVLRPKLGSPGAVMLASKAVQLTRSS